jgi:sulfate permease, SulP family
MRLEGRVFFANAERIGQKMRLLVDEAKPKIIALDLSAVTDLEYTALKTLIESEHKARERGVLLWLVGLNRQVMTMVMRSQLGETLGRERMFFNLEMAVAKYLELPPTEHQPSSL